MARPHPLPSAACALALLCAGCLAPLLGSDEEIGAQESQQIRREMGLVADRELQAYVDAIGQRVAAHAAGTQGTYRFAVVDRPEPNAFALPGGYVYVSRGLLALLNTEDELACVLGHEIGHVSARHSARRINVAAPFAIASGITGFATGLVSPRLGQAVAGAGHTVTQGLIVAPYSRHQEREADRIGIELAARAGWDPAAMSRLLETLARDEALTGDSRVAGFLDSHPSTPERAAESARRAAGLERAAPAPIAGSRAALLERLDGLILGEDPAQGVFNQQLFLQPQVEFAVRFPEGWNIVNTREVIYTADPSLEVFASLHVAGRGDDPHAAGRALGEKLQEELELRALPDAALPTAGTDVSARSEGGPALVRLIWIAHGGWIYQLTGVVPEPLVEQHGERIPEIARSFRPLRGDELAAIRESRLRSARARGGESLGALLQREGSSWSPERAAVANALAADARLAEGALIKLALPEPYTHRSD